MVSTKIPNGLLGLRDYATAKGYAVDWNPKEGVKINGKSVDVSGLQNLNDKNYGTVTQLDALLKPFSTTIDSPYSGYVNNNVSNLQDAVNNIPTYDVTKDVLYAPLKAQYEQAGQTDFNNTIGRLASLTGGNPSSAAIGNAIAARNKQTQTFESNVLPQLTSQYYDRYNQNIQNRMGLLNTSIGMEDTAYNRKQSQQAFDYQKSRDTVADTQWQKTMNLNLRQQTFQEAQTKIQNALSARQISNEEASQAIQWARLNAEQDPNSIDNQLKVKNGGYNITGVTKNADGTYSYNLSTDTGSLDYKIKQAQLDLMNSGGVTDADIRQKAATLAIDSDGVFSQDIFTQVYNALKNGVTTNTGATSEKPWYLP